MSLDNELRTTEVKDSLIGLELYYLAAALASGSIYDFWMPHRGCDFNTAVTQLASMLL
jgi:hypothetical protein